MQERHADQRADQDRLEHQVDPGAATHRRSGSYRVQSIWGGGGVPFLLDQTGRKTPVSRIWE